MDICAHNEFQNAVKQTINSDGLSKITSYNNI